MTRYEMQMLYAQCKEEARRAGATRPRGFIEGMIEGIDSSNGVRFENREPVQRRWKEATDALFEQKLQQMGR